MIIKKLILSSFGKFTNKNIELSDGLNIIYGENEAGKTTIHKFIEGMFFGFFKPYTKRRTYTEEYDRYLSMDKNEYCGILKYEYNGNIYRIERNFMKDNGDLKIYDDTTGGDITNYFEYDSVTRLHNPASRHVNINKTIFNNTISIAQLSSKTDDELLIEVKDNLTNLGGTLDEEISIKRVLEKLENQKEEIGTKKRVKTSPYGRIVEKISKLEEEIKYTKIILSQMNSKVEDLNNIKTEIKELKSQKKELQKQLVDLETYERYKQYQQVKKLEVDIEDLTNEISSLSNYAKVNTEDYTETIKLSNQLEELEKRKQTKIKKLENLEQKILDIKEKTEDISSLSIGNNIKFDLYTYQEKEKELENLKKNKIYIDLEEHRKSLKILKVKNEKFNKVKIISIILAVLFIVIGVLTDIKVMLLAILPLIATTYCIKNNKGTKTDLRKVNKYIIDTETRETQINERIEKLETETSEILKKYNLNNKEDLQVKVNQLDKNYELGYEYNNLKKEKSEIKAEINGITADYIAIEDNIEFIVERNNLKNIEEFKEVIDKKDRYNKLTPMLESKYAILKNTLKNESIYDLESEFNDFNIEDLDTDNVESIDKKMINELIEDISNKIVKKGKEATKIEENINNLQERTRDMRYIEEEIDRKESLKLQYEEDLNALELAKNTIEDISRRIRKDFSPKLNTIASNILGSITNDKYKDVKIDENLNIRVVDTKDRLLDIKNLSAGTIEQIYFSTRIGINEVIRQGEKLPIIVDDAFVQYDDNRLVNMLNFLYRESLERQVIIFTCQTREKEILKKLSLRHKLIEL